MAELPKTGGSFNSLMEANRERAEKSDHGGLGASGKVDASTVAASGPGKFLTKPGEVSVVNPPKEGLPNFNIAVSWDNVAVEESGNAIEKFIKKDVLKRGVDLDLGCLYRLKNATRGGMQAFGNIHGSLEGEPYIKLSSDERTGDREGPDETLIVNGSKWDEIEQILLYIYIYDGADSWADVHPQVRLDVPGHPTMTVTLTARQKGMRVCAVAGIDNVRGGIKLTSYLEYFPGHTEMDRAFGFGLEWEGGRKDA